MQLYKMQDNDDWEEEEEWDEDEWEEEEDEE